MMLKFVCLAALLCLCYAAPEYIAPMGLKGLAKETYDMLEQRTLEKFGAVPEHIDRGLLKRFVEEQLTQEDIQRICKGFGRSVFNHMSCETKETGKTASQVYIEMFGMPKQEELAPIILVPGLGGSGLEAHIDKDDGPAWYCAKKSNWFQIWLSLYELLVQPCWFDNLQINFHPDNNTYTNREGVSIREKDWGGLKGVDYLDHFEMFMKLTTYFGEMIVQLEHLGYRKGVNLWGAPYDWRLDSAHLYNETDWRAKFNNLIDIAYQRAGNKKVHVITHSMGGPTVLYFLNQKELNWKQDKIASFVPIAGPWTGSPKALRAMISGDDFGMSFMDLSLVNKHRLGRLARQSGGVAYLTPEARMWPAGFVFVETPTKNYTAKDFMPMFMDLKSPVTTEVLRYTDDLIIGLSHPLVPTYCLYGYNVNTEIKYRYNVDFNTLPEGTLPDQPMIWSDDCGDGSVPLDSLMQCRLWDAEDAPDINCREYNLRDHSAILKDQELILDVARITTGRTDIDGCEKEKSRAPAACNPTPDKRELRLERY